jgi:hypothetical protein
MKKHYVTFSSPGTFISEQTTKPIDSWDVDLAVEMSKEIKERHGALPYGFHFSTRKRGFKDMDSKEVKRSNMYFLGGKVLTLADVETQNDPSNKVLISNMKINGWDRVIENNNSWKITLPLNDDDVILAV